MPRRQPSSSMTSASGAVATTCEGITNTVRRRSATGPIQGPQARTTLSATTVPDGVSTVAGRPRRGASSACTRRRARRPRRRGGAGRGRAAPAGPTGVGITTPPSASGEPHIARASSASRRRDEVRRARAARARRRPPRGAPAARRRARPEAAAERGRSRCRCRAPCDRSPTPLTDSSSSQRASSAPKRATSVGNDSSQPLTQPPLRPEAPAPQTNCSTSTTSVSGASP